LPKITSREHGYNITLIFSRFDADILNTDEKGRVITTLGVPTKSIIIRVITALGVITAYRFIDNIISY